MASEDASDTSTGPIAAPPLDGGTAWLNVSRPLSWADLRGKVVLLDFWTYGCIIASKGGEVMDTIGSGLVGDADGIFAQARFHRPQGLALDRSTLYVADTENSPWGLALKPGILIVAMAGSHQIWVVDLVNGQAYPYAGSGREARQDGSVRDATFAQPSGLALDGDSLFVADAESNIIRMVTLPPVNEVTTLAGGDLFEFGDADDRGDAARFQHPLGVAVHDGLVYVADTYNHKVRVLDPRTRSVRTVAGDGTPGFADGRAARARFFEPGGITAAGGRLFVADTNNHAIRCIEAATGDVTTLTLAGLGPPAAWSYLRR